MKLQRTLIAILIGIMNLYSAYAQTDSEFWAEEFLAEVFYGDMTEKSPKVYLEKQTTVPFSLNTILKEDILVISYNVPYSDNADDVLEMTYEEYDNPIMWNENAPVFQQPKYKNLIFVDDISKLSKKKRKKAEERRFCKPVFSESGQYALIETESYSIRKRSWKYRWRSFPYKDFWKARHDFSFSCYHKLYQRINNKWVRIDEWYIGGGHN